MNDETEQFRNIFENIPEAMIVTDAQGQVRLMNRAAKALLGEPEEVFGLEEWPQRFGLFLDDGRMSYPAKKLPLALALAGEPASAEELILRRDGDIRSLWISMSARPILNEQESAEGAIVLIQDITYSRQVETSREKHAQRMEALYRLSRNLSEGGHDLDQISQGIASFAAEVIGDICSLMLLDSVTEKLSVAAFHDPDPTAKALFRKVLAEISEFNPREGIVGGVIKSGEPMLIPSIPIDQLQAISQPAFKDFVNEIGIQSVLIVPIIGHGGVLGALSLSRHRDRKPYTAEDQSFLTDIAYRAALAIENCRLFETLREEVLARLSTEQALNASEERFRAIFESTTLGIKVLDLDGNILQTNPSFQTLTGYSEAELIGKRFTDFLYPGDDARAMRLINDLKVSGVPDFRFEHRIVCKDGSLLWAKTTFTAVNKGGSDRRLAFIVGILEDITEQKRIEMEMGEIKNRLQNNIELERLRLAQDLHDGPMQELYGAIYTLEDLRISSSEANARSIQEVNDIILNVIQGLRDITKELRPSTISNFGLESAIRSHIEDFRARRPEIKVRLSLARDGQTLPENVRLALFRVYQQSMANILRHSEASEVQIRFSFDSEEARLEIRDNGVGFEVPSNWIKLVRSGHYGLAGAKERVTVLGGVLQVESRLGDSTVVRVVIPIKNNLANQPGKGVRETVF